MAKVKVPPGGGQFSVNGEVYVPSRKGIAEVPAECLAELASHGILPIADADDADAGGGGKGGGSDADTTATV